MIVGWGAGGLALATSLSAFVNLAVQAVLLYRRLGGFPWTAWLSSLAWSGTGCVAMAAPLWWVASRIDWVSADIPFLFRIVLLGVAILVGSSCYGLVAWCGGAQEFRTLTGILPQRALRFLPQFLQPSQ